MKEIVDSAHVGMSIEQRRALLAPGERAYGLMPDGTRVVIVGRVPYDGSTRQQRRAMARAGIDEHVVPADVPSGE